MSAVSEKISMERKLMALAFSAPRGQFLDAEDRRHRGAERHDDVLVGERRIERLDDVRRDHVADRLQAGEARVSAASISACGSD